MHFLSKRERVLYCHQRPLPATRLRLHFFTIMRICTIVFLLTFTGAFALLAKSGHGQGMRDTKISLDEKNTSLDVVLSRIEKLSAFHFIYQSEMVRQQKIARFKADQASLKNVPHALLTPRGFSFKQMGENIIIDLAKNTGKKPVTIEAARQSAISGKIVNEKGEATPGVTVMVKESRQVTSFPA